MGGVQKLSWGEGDGISRLGSSGRGRGIRKSRAWVESVEHSVSKESRWVRLEG
jgi:hypothetical protein